MYKTLENQKTFDKYLHVQAEVSKIKDRQTRALSRQYTVTGLIVNEILGYIAHSIFYQKLRAKA